MGSLLRIVQVTDTHIFSNKDRSLLGVNTEESFLSVINLLKEHELSPNIILLTGDISQDGSEAAYSRIADIISEFNVPTYCLPGNHDNLSLMEKIYPRGMISMQKQVIVDGWQFILLDTHIQGRAEGQLAPAELQFLDYCLQSHPMHRAIIVLHHHPIPVGSAWLDNIAIKNSADFWDVVSQYQHVHTILFGHVHQEFEGSVGNVRCYSTPSTCFQFKKESDKFALEKLAPAYRVIELSLDGKLKTRVQRTAQYVGTFNAGAKGY